MSGDEWVPLRVLVVNTHVGMLLTSAVRDLKRTHRPHAVLLQEVQSPLARARLRLVFRWGGWSLVGTRPGSRGRGSSGTIVAARRSRLKLRNAHNSLLSRYLDRMHPERRLTRGEYVDRRSRRRLTLCSMHTWHIVRANGVVRAEHDRQLAQYAHAARRAELAIFAGDVNESRGRGVALKLMSEAGMVPVIVHGVDGAWVTNSGDVELVDVETIPLMNYRGGESSHDALLVSLRIRVR